jgi:uncharacterized membrane protein
LRALAAVFGLLTLPCVFWFARELYGSSGPAWIAVGLTAISPFQFLYSQEAREYSLWAATSALVCAALLYALRTRTRRSWAFYMVSLALALYTFPLSLLILASQAVFVVICARRALARFAIAAGIGLVAYMPWALVAARNRAAFRAGTDWTSESISFVSLLKSWLIALAANIVDKRGDTGLSAGVATLFAVVVLLQLLALVYIWARGPRAAAVFLSCLFAASFLTLAAVDLIGGGVRSTVPRFIVPAYIAVTIALGYLVYRGIDSGSRAARIGSVVLAVGAIACAIGSYTHQASARVWWNQDDGAAPENRTVADVINRGQGSFLMATGGGALLELTNYLRPETRVRLVLDGAPPSVPPAGTNAFAYGSPATRVAARRLGLLLSSLRTNGATLERLDPSLACCGADIRRLRDQFWRVQEP